MREPLRGQPVRADGVQLWLWRRWREAGIWPGRNVLPAEVDRVRMDAAACPGGVLVSRRALSSLVQPGGHRTSVTSTGTMRKLTGPGILLPAISVAELRCCRCKMSVNTSLVASDLGADGRGLSIEAPRRASIGNSCPMDRAVALAVAPTASSANRSARLPAIGPVATTR